MLTGEGGPNSCHDCEGNKPCRFSICELWLCKECTDIRFPPRNSPLQRLQNVVKSIGRAGKQVMQKAGTRTLQKTTSTGSIRNFLPVRPMQDLVEGPTTSVDPNSSDISAMSTSQNITPAQQPGNLVAASETPDLLSPQGSVQSESIVISPTQVSQTSYRLRRSRRLQGDTIIESQDQEPEISQKDGKKSKKKAKGTKTKKAKRKSLKPPEPLQPVRCCICMKWCEAPDEEIYGGTVWNCESCRNLPSTVAEMRNDLKSLMQTNTDLVSNLARKVAENDELRKENVQLRQLVNSKPQNPAASNKHLILSDASMEGAISTNKSTEVVIKPDLTIEGCRQLLAQKSKNTYDTITIVVGRSDCSAKNPIDEMANDLEMIIHEGKSISNSVQVSSVLPQTNSRDTQEHIELFNSAAEVICTEQHVAYVNNEPSFRLGDGEICQGFLSEDGYLPNLSGKLKLMKNLGINESTKIHVEEKWKSAPQKKPVHQQKYKTQQNTQPPKRRAPCYNCGLGNHTSNLCRFKQRASCHKCGKLGHISSVCTTTH